MKRLLLAALPALPALMPLPAVAHVEITSPPALRGAEAEITLTIGHGCKGAATTGLRLELPASLSAVALVPDPAWTATVTATEIRWQGGPLSDHSRHSLRFRAQIAADAPDPIALPVIQICGNTQSDWIGSGGDHPAPLLRLRAAP